jgi:Ca2+-binding EF-hand superfamily protein
LTSVDSLRFLSCQKKIIFFVLLSFEKMGNQSSTSLSESSAKGLSKDDEEKLKEMTSFTPEELAEHSKHFFDAYPTGEITKTEFVRDNKRLRGGTDEFWSAVYTRLTSKSSDGRLSVQEYIVGLQLHQHASPTEKIAWAFGVCLKRQRMYMGIGFD